MEGTCSPLLLATTRGSRHFLQFGCCNSQGRRAGVLSGLATQPFQRLLSPGGNAVSSLGWLADATTTNFAPSAAAVNGLQCGIFLFGQPALPAASPPGSGGAAAGPQLPPAAEVAGEARLPHATWLPCQGYTARPGNILPYPGYTAQSVQ